ncbi:DNA polymerase lambda [Symbiodinium microadriaticum]|uniref:DNA polymerase n=1 Tax=Symbiodinium microadriaticum TaxID=2951 RepID=A0A1Q9BXA8_SYMMI|nr:DNA polymerase lambda [Symbiodinium microadriaticum]
MVFTGWTMAMGTVTTGTLAAKNKVHRHDGLILIGRGVAKRLGLLEDGAQLYAAAQCRGFSRCEEELGGHAPNSPWEDGEETFLGVFRLTEEGALHRRVDLILCQRAHRPLVLLNWTGSGLFLRELHRLASYKGLKISPTQLLARASQGTVVVPVTAEEDVFEMLGLPYRPPSERELDDSLMRFVQASRPGGPALKRQKSESTSSQAASAAASASQILCLEISEDES